MAYSKNIATDSEIETMRDGNYYSDTSQHTINNDNRIEWMWMEEAKGRRRSSRVQTQAEHIFDTISLLLKLVKLQMLLLPSGYPLSRMDLRSELKQSFFFVSEAFSVEREVKQTVMAIRANRYKLIHQTYIYTAKCWNWKTHNAQRKKESIKSDDIAI